MRLLALACLAVVLPVANAAVSPAFGEPGAPHWDEYAAPEGFPDADRAGEPTIGIPWDTGSIFFIAHSRVYRITVNDTAANATWEALPQANPVEDTRRNLDPMLHADPVTGRIWAGGLYGACSVMSYSDDDGATWSPTANMCGVYGVDHQTIGSGPWAPGPGAGTYPRAVYYCAHGQALGGAASDLVFSGASPTACITSPDGGVSWGAPVPWTGGCGSLHGHVKVGPGGFAAVPDADCSVSAGSLDMLAGFAYSDNNGLSWGSRRVEGSVGHPGFNNPALDFGHQKGWLWYAQAASDGALVALSKDNGTTWEKIGPSANTTWLDVGAFHDPPIAAATFPKVVAGDDDRVAVSFMGVEAPADGDAPNVFQCTQDQDEIVWHYYVAMSYDAGASWRVQRLTKDPVQVGGVWQGQVPPGESNWCRNLLDFNDMDIDGTGRLTISFADGCIQECAATPTSDSEGYRARYATILRQATGNGLFAAHDVAPPGDFAADREPGFATYQAPPPAEEGTEPSASTPGPGALALLGVLAVAVVLSRRR